MHNLHYSNVVNIFSIDTLYCRFIIKKSICVRKTKIIHTKEIFIAIKPFNRLHRQKFKQTLLVLWGKVQPIINPHLGHVSV